MSCVLWKFGTARGTAPLECTIRCIFCGAHTTTTTTRRTKGQGQGCQNMRESLESTKQRYPHHTHYQGLDDDNDEPRARFVCCPFPCAVCCALPALPVPSSLGEGKARRPMINKLFLPLSIQRIAAVASLLFSLPAPPQPLLLLLLVLCSCINKLVFNFIKLLPSGNQLTSRCTWPQTVFRTGIDIRRP